MADHVRERRRCLEILELGPAATEDEIKKAYKAMALKYHPDKNKNEGATEHFQEIQYAYKYLQEGPQILDHTSDDDDDGIPIIFLMRLFPWLFQTYAGGGKRSSRTPFFAYDFGYDSSSDEEYDTPDDDYRASTYKSTGSGPSAESSTSGKSRKTETKRQKKKRAKQKKKEEKSAAKAQKEKPQAPPTSDCKDNVTAPRTQPPPASDCKDNLTTPVTQTDQSKDEDSEKQDSGVGSGPSSDNISLTTSTDSAAGPLPQAEQNQGRHSESISEDSSQASANAEAPNQESKESGSCPLHPLQPPTQPLQQPLKKSKQQIREEQRKREEEAIKIRKELEEKLRLEQERKARKQAAKEEKERQEAARRKQQEEQEIAAEAERLMLELKRQEEEKAKKQKEEEEEREKQQLFAELDFNMYMDASGDFLTRDSEGVGNIKKRTLVYNNPQYDNLWEQHSERPAFGAPPSYNQPYGSYRGHRGYASARGRGYPQGGPGRGGSPPKPNFQPGSYPETMEPSSPSWEEQVQMHERLEEQRQASKNSLPGDNRRMQGDAQSASATSWGPPEGLRQTLPLRFEFYQQHAQGRGNQSRGQGTYRPHNPTTPRFRGGLNGPQGNSSSASFAQQSNYAHAMPRVGTINHSSAARSADKVLHNGFASDGPREGGSEHVKFSGSREGNIIHGGDAWVEGKSDNLNRPTSEVKSPSPEKRDHSNGGRHDGAGVRCSSVSSDGSDVRAPPSRPHFSPRMSHPFNPTGLHATGAGPPPLLPFPTPGVPPGFNLPSFVGVPSFTHAPLFAARPATPQPFASQPAVTQRTPTPSQMKSSAPAFVHRPQVGPSSQPASHGPQFVSSQQTGAHWTVNQPTQTQGPLPRGTVPPFDFKLHSGTSFPQISKPGGGGGDIQSVCHGLDDIDD